LLQNSKNRISALHSIDISAGIDLLNMFYRLLGEPTTFCETLIICENNVTNITCPDSMSIFIIDGFYGRRNGDV